MRAIGSPRVRQRVHTEVRYIHTHACLSWVCLSIRTRSMPVLCILYIPYMHTHVGTSVHTYMWRERIK